MTIHQYDIIHLLYYNILIKNLKLILGNIMNNMNLGGNIVILGEVKINH